MHQNYICYYFVQFLKKCALVKFSINTYIYLIEEMDEVGDEDEIIEILIKRPFIPKFFRELNHQQNEKAKKNKRKQKPQSQIDEKKLQKFQKLGLKFQNKSLKKLPEVNRNGNRIIAAWKNDQINGMAEIHYNNGVKFKGIYQNGVKVKGHFKFLNGYEYIGFCLGNKFYGEGSLIFPSGKIITGEWRQYNVIGNGKIEYPQGQVYYGEIINFKKHGKGYLFFGDGSKYVGEFENGLITGSGIYYIDDEIASQGIWNNGELIKQQVVEVKQQQIQCHFDKEAQNKGKQQFLEDTGIKNTSLGDFLIIDEDAGQKKRVRFNGSSSSQDE